MFEVNLDDLPVSAKGLTSVQREDSKVFAAKIILEYSFDILLDVAST
jgi:hypothetical protein